MAVADGVTNFSSKEVLTKYQLGTSVNIKNLKKVATEKDLIDILPGNKIELQDPVFEYWLKHIYRLYYCSKFSDNCPYPRRLNVKR